MRVIPIPHKFSGHRQLHSHPCPSALTGGFVDDGLSGWQNAWVFRLVAEKLIDGLLRPGQVGNP